VYLTIFSNNIYEKTNKTVALNDGIYIEASGINMGMLAKCDCLTYFIFLRGNC